MIKTKIGIVKQNSTKKTLIIEIQTFFKCLKYKKLLKNKKKILVHNPFNKIINIGSVVSIYKINPISCLKFWVLKKILKLKIK